MLFFFCKEKSAYEIEVWLKFGRVLFRSRQSLVNVGRPSQALSGCQAAWQTTGRTTTPPRTGVPSSEAKSGERRKAVSSTEWVPGCVESNRKNEHEGMNVCAKCGVKVW